MDPPETNMTPSDISLRPFNLSDVNDFMVWACDDQVSRFCGWHTLVNEEDALARIQNYVIPHPWYRAICIKDRSIGYILVQQGQQNEKCRAEIGYGLASKYWGQGIATVAVKMVISSVFREMPDLERLEAQIVAENVKSQRVVERAGFIREGVLRKYWINKGITKDIVVYSLLKTDVLPDVN